MLAADSNASSSPSLESLNKRVTEAGPAPCYNLCGRTSVAIANLHLRDDGRGECGVLLFPDAAFPPGSRRFRLGRARRPARAGRAESLRHSARTISPDRRIFWSALRLVAPRDGGRSLLRHQLRPAGFWHQQPRLSSPAGIPGLSLLGRPAGGAV